MGDTIRVWERIIRSGEALPEWLWESGVVLHAKEVNQCLEGWLAIFPTVTVVDVSRKAVRKEFWFGRWSTLLYLPGENGPTLEEIEALPPLLRDFNPASWISSPS